MASKSFKRAPVRTSVLRKRADLFKTTMAIVRHICAEINDSDVEEVTWIDSDLGTYSLAIMVHFVEIGKRDAVLSAASSRHPLYTDDIPIVKETLAHRKLSLYKELPKDIPECVQQCANSAPGESGAPSTSNKKE